jgi:hypothetical protein
MLKIAFEDQCDIKPLLAYQGCFKIRKITQQKLDDFWRRKRDLNPRAGYPDLRP